MTAVIVIYSLQRHLLVTCNEDARQYFVSDVYVYKRNQVSFLTSLYYFDVTVQHRLQQRSRLEIFAAILGRINIGNERSLNGLNNLSALSQLSTQNTSNFVTRESHTFSETNTIITK